MYNQDVLDLYPRVDVGTKVTVTYQRFAGTVAMSSAAPFSSPTNSSSRTSRTATSPSSEGGGSLFSLFGYDDEPPRKQRRKVPRAKSASAKAGATKGVASQ
jgi:hypothetical protein